MNWLTDLWSRQVFDCLSADFVNFVGCRYDCLESKRNDFDWVADSSTDSIVDYYNAANCFCSAVPMIADD
jgi:hypothetical protein